MKRKNQKKIENNIERCPRFPFCSANVCPLDPEAYLKERLPGEDRCPFTKNKKSKFERGLRTLMPRHLLKFVPEWNVKLLNRRNKMRWFQKVKNDEERLYQSAK